MWFPTLYWLSEILISSFQQAFNATVAIRQMKKLQLAHSEACLKHNSPTVPEIKVIATSTPESVRKKQFAETPQLNGHAPSHQINVPSGSTEAKSQYHPIRVSHSETTHVGTLTIAEKGKHVYHSEPADLNGYVFKGHVMENRSLFDHLNSNSLNLSYENVQKPPCNHEHINIWSPMFTYCTWWKAKYLN